MANLKLIRDRIQSVKNTKKITEAMRLVAAAKVRSERNRAAARRHRRRIEMKGQRFS